MKIVKRPAFTLVELLVVIAIIGILVALLLPAVQAAREAARRSSCCNNLGQLALAIQSYDAAHGSLPPGVVNPTGPIESLPQGYHVNWLVHLLPYIEQQNAYSMFDFSAGVYDRANASLRNWGDPLFLCPSDPGSVGLGNLGVTNYAGCHHDVKAPIDADNHGVFFLNSGVRYRDITDGSSHTIFLGEKLIGPNDLGWASGTRASLRNMGSPLNGTSTVGGVLEQIGEGSAYRWGMPQGTPPTANANPALVVGGFESYHPAGANCAFGDGSVRTLSTSTAQPTILQQLGHRSDGKLLDARKY